MCGFITGHPRISLTSLLTQLTSPEKKKELLSAVHSAHTDLGSAGRPSTLVLSAGSGEPAGCPLRFTGADMGWVILDRQALFSRQRGWV